MKLTQSTVVALSSIIFGIVVCAALLLLTALFSGNSAGIPIIFILLVLLAALGVAVTIFYRQVFLPLRRIRDFTTAAARGENPQHLDGGIGDNNQIRNIARNLNVIRDRMQNLETKLSRNLAYDLKSHHQREHLDQLKNDFFNDILPEIRRSAGVVNGQLLLQQKRLEKSLPYDQEILKKSISRIDTISRDLEKLSDIDRINWERWNSPRNDKFDTSELIHDVLENDRLNSRTRNVKIVSQVSGELPGRLCIDRELLFQLLSLLTRSACRLAEPKSEVLFNCGRDHRNEAVFEIAFHSRLAEKIASNKLSGESRQIKPGEGIIPGLQIVKSCAGLIGCLLDISSPEKDKVIFTLSLPQGSSTYSAGSFSALPNHPFFPVERKNDDSTVKIMLFDDDTDDAEVITELLADQKIQTTVATDMEKCRELLENDFFDALLITTFPINQTQWETIKQLRNYSKRKKLPTVIASGALSEATIRQIKRCDNCYLMPVPLNYRLLAEVLHRIRG